MMPPAIPNAPGLTPLASKLAERIAARGGRLVNADVTPRPLPGS